MSKEKELSAREQRVRKRQEIKEGLKGALKDKKLWAIAGTTTTAIGFTWALYYYLGRRADKEIKPSLEEIARQVEEAADARGGRLGEGTILAIAPEIAQDLEELGEKEEGRRFLRWLKRVCRFGGAPPATETLEEQIIFAGTAAGERLVKPEIGNTEV